MNGNELIVLAAAGALQLITISLWLTAAYNCRWWRDRALMLEADLNYLWRNSVRRDQRTGRYVKKGN